MSSDSDTASSKPASFEGTPYRALLAEGASFDITVNERTGVLLLHPLSDEDDRAASSPSEEVAYRFERLGGGHALLMMNGRSVPVVISEAGKDEVHITIGGRTATVRIKDETALLLERFGIAEGAGAAEAEVRAPMPGLVVRVLVEEGQEVAEGDGLLVLEAMKMENELRAPAGGTVTTLHAEEGASAGKGEVLVEIEAA